MLITLFLPRAFQLFSIKNGILLHVYQHFPDLQNICRLGCEDCQANQRLESLQSEMTMWRPTLRDRLWGLLIAEKLFLVIFVSLGNPRSNVFAFIELNKLSWNFLSTYPIIGGILSDQCVALEQKLAIFLILRKIVNVASVTKSSTEMFTLWSLVAWDAQVCL